MITSKPKSFSHVEKQVKRFKQRAGEPAYAAVFGKTYVSKDSPEYLFAKEMGSLLIKEKIGIIHGGYSGMMTAVSTGANGEISKDDTKSKYWNIGVPCALFDGSVQRADCLGTHTTTDIHTRKRVLLDSADLFVVLPVGGMGTLTEAIEAYHLNQLAEKFGGKIRPIIFIGQVWKTIFSTFSKEIDFTQQPKGSKFAYFCSQDIAEIREHIRKVVKHLRGRKNEQ
jgi:predicted Rossmann-fold nucleotide-binding protein